MGLTNEKHPTYTTREYLKLALLIIKNTAMPRVSERVTCLALLDRMMVDTGDVTKN